MKYLILNYGQYRHATICFEHNIKQIRSQLNSNDTLDICILSQYESDRDRQNYLEQFINNTLLANNCNLIFLKYIEEYKDDIYEVENKIQENYDNYISNSDIKNGADLHSKFVCKLWYRKYFLNLLYKRFITTNYDYVFLTRLFDTKLEIIKPFDFLKNQTNTLYYAHDTTFIGSPDIIDKLLEFGKDMYSNLRVHKEMLIDIDFLKEFNKQDRCLSECNAIYSSEMQICNFIYYNIPNSINIRYDFTDLEERSQEKAYIDIRIVR
jgi:hypothetical protein